jgi:hypothetical protein
MPGLPYACLGLCYDLMKRTFSLSIVIQSLVVTVGAVLCLATASHAFPAQGALKQMITGPLQDLAQSLPVITTVRAQNSMHLRITSEDIATLDARWRKGDQSLIGPVMENDLSAYLTNYARQSEGLYSEIFVIDQHGLNVGQSAITSDYWQGDEEIFTHAFAGEAHVSPVAFDEYSKLDLIKVSLPVRNEDGEIIGVLVVGVDPEKLPIQP